MVKLNYYYANKKVTYENDKPVTHEEMIIDGPKGLLIKYYHKENDVVNKITIKSKDGKYSVNVISGDKKEDSEIDKKELVKLLKTHKLLTFAKDYASQQLKRLR
jgi:hypothetical protein